MFDKYLIDVEYQKQSQIYPTFVPKLLTNPQNPPKIEPEPIQNAIIFVDLLLDRLLIDFWMVFGGPNRSKINQKSNQECSPHVDTIFEHTWQQK